MNIMNKNKSLWAASALLIAGTLVANAESTKISLPDYSSGFTWVNGFRTGMGSGETSVVSETVIANLIGKIPAEADRVGWFGGLAQDVSLNSYPNDISITGEDSFKFTSRPKLSGEYVMLGVDLTEDAKSITLNFTTDVKVSYSLWSYDADSATVSQLIADTFKSEAGSVSATYDASNVSSSTIFAVWLANSANQDAALSGATKITISDIGLSYVAAPSVPEPSMFGLLAGLGALALASSRRRRRSE